MLPQYLTEKRKTAQLQQGKCHSKINVNIFLKATVIIQKTIPPIPPLTPRSFFLPRSCSYCPYSAKLPGPFSLSQPLGHKHGHQQVTQALPAGKVRSRVLKNTPSMTSKLHKLFPSWAAGFWQPDLGSRDLNWEAIEMPLKGSGVPASLFSMMRVMFQGEVRATGGGKSNGDLLPPEHARLAQKQASPPASLLCPLPNTSSSCSLVFFSVKWE